MKREPNCCNLPTFTFNHNMFILRSKLVSILHCVLVNVFPFLSKYSPRISIYLKIEIGVSLNTGTIQGDQF